MYMNYITTTKLRTQSPSLVATLKRGGVVSLIHHSKIIGVIQPVRVENLDKPFNAEQFECIVKHLQLPHTTVQQRKKRYTTHLLKKYN